jgi:glycosyltransferase involved in cell wall biosynthesis
MNILLIANYLGDGQESMLRFAGLMEQGLLEAGHEVSLVRPPVFFHRFWPGPEGLRKWMGYVDKFVIFPFRLPGALRRAELVHICDHSNAMYSAFCNGTPCVVTCHDMLAVRGAMGEVADCAPSFTGRWLQRWIVRGMRKAGAVVSVSTATSADVSRIVNGPPQPRKVILNALNHPYRSIPREEAWARLRDVAGLNATRPFVLHVGQNHPRKNREGVIRSFARACRKADLQLVLAGQPLNRELEELVRAERIADRVTVVAKPGNEVLEALYNCALLLYFPSRYEGFGWPLIEAQACGCPVLCSRCEPFAEVVGDSAIMRDVEDESGFADEIVRLARDPGVREQWAERGLRNVARFAPQQMIAAYLDLYQELVTGQ